MDLAALPEELLLKVMSNLDIQTMGRVECWSKAWGDWLAPHYHKRWCEWVRDEALRVEEENARADALWAECWSSYVTYGYFSLM
jgi:hypothetical protein